MTCTYTIDKRPICDDEATHRVVNHVLDPGHWSIMEGEELLRRLNGDVISYPNEPGVPQGPIMMQPEFCLMHAMEVMETRTQASTKAAHAQRAPRQRTKVPKAA